jgi:hypothetical protein
VSDGKIRREVLIGSLLIAAGFFLCIIAYFGVVIQVDILDVARLNSRDAINNLVALLTLLSVGCLFLGVLGGYIIGKYRHT